MKGMPPSSYTWGEAPPGTARRIGRSRSAEQGAVTTSRVFDRHRPLVVPLNLQAEQSAWPSALSSPPIFAPSSPTLALPLCDETYVRGSKVAKPTRVIARDERSRQFPRHRQENTRFLLRRNDTMVAVRRRLDDLSRLRPSRTNWRPALTTDRGQVRTSAPLRASRRSAGR
jgi:hypothetical protein